jgi:methylated-DNA-[protein]-cysteine S-methyltransferase
MLTAQTAAQWKMTSKAGDIYLVASNKGLRSLYFSKRDSDPMAKDLKSPAPEIQILAQAVRELEEYFDKKRKAFTVPLDAQGTEFQKKVWEQLAKIPFGKTASYKDIAAGLKNDKAFRAVGTANGKNPLSIIVPCHRVIAANGTLGGYSGGLLNKVKLLELEGVTGFKPSF